MSYSKIKSFSFSKDFKTVKVTSACNNVHPLSYYKQVLEQKDNKKLKDSTVYEWVKSWIKDFLDGGLQFNNKKHYINFVINKTMQDNNILSSQELWASPYDFNAKYDYDLEKWIFPDDKKEKEYNQAVLKREMIENEITKNIIYNTYRSLYNQLKKDKFYLTNDYQFITSNGLRSFKYSGKDASNKKVFSGLDKMNMIDYFAIKNYGYHFQKVEV